MGNTYEKTITVEQKDREKIEVYLNNPDRDHHQDEDDTIIYGVIFSNGMSAEIKCCGVQFEEENDNSSWCEMVLFEKEYRIRGDKTIAAWFEVACSDVADTFFGEWEMEYEGDIYRVIVN